MFPYKRFYKTYQLLKIRNSILSTLGVTKSLIQERRIIEWTCTTWDLWNLIQVEALLTRSLTSPVYTFPCWGEVGRCVSLLPIWWFLFGGGVSFVFYLFLFLKGSMYVANCWGVGSEALWNHANCVPGCGVTLLLRSCSSRKISSVIRALRRGFVLLFRNAEFPVAGPSALMKGLLLGTAGESWSGPWQDSSEESLDLVLGLWWAGSCIVC